MDSRSWGVELWDQMDFLIQFENDQLALQDNYYRLLSEIQKSVADFGKKYRKIVSNFVPRKKTGSSIDSKLTFNTALTDSLASFLKVGMVFENYGAELQKSVITPLKEEYDSERKVADEVAANYIKFNAQREKGRKRLEDTWRAHVIALKEKQKAEALNTQAQGDFNVTPEDRLKAQNVLSAKKDAFVETQQTYASEMAKFNEKQRYHFTHNIHMVISDLESIERQRAQVMKDLLTKCSDMGESLSKQLTDTAFALRNTVSRINPEEDCNAVLEARKTEFMFPVDLPFLNLSQCTQATLDNQSALVSLMLGSSNGFSVKNNTEKAPKSFHTIFGKSKSQSFDGNVLQTPFIAGIGYKPVKESEMTVIQLNDRIKTLGTNLDKVKGSIEATQRLLDSCRDNPKLGNAQDAEMTIVKLQRQALSLTSLITSLESRYNSMGGDQALLEAQSSLECSNPYSISSPTDNPRPPPKRTPRHEQSTAEFESDLDEPTTPAPYGYGDYVGQATLKYDCDGNDQGCIAGKAGESFHVLEADNDGSGWTAVVSADGHRQGFLPTSHLSITLH